MRRYLVAFLAVGLLAAACSSAEDGEVAVVNGVPIVLSDVTELVTTEGAIAIDDEFREVLFRVVAMEAMEQAMLADFDATPDEAAVDALTEEFLAEIEAGGETPATATGIATAGEGMIRFNAALITLRDTVVQALASDPESVQAIVDDASAVTTVCVRHILVSTEEEAVAASERLAAGEDFAEVANEVSMDTATPGGDLGCSLAARYVEPFATTTVIAPVGELTDPIETEFGFHVLIVDERSAPTAEQITADPTAYLTDAAASNLWSDWFNATLRGADVEVDPRYGRWSETGLGITAVEDE